MNLFGAILSGILQGITEFLPVSSSGHLVFLHHLLGIKESQVLFDISLHIGTLLAVIAYFWKDILDLINRKRIVFYIFVASVPTAIIGFLFKEKIDALFLNVKLVGIMMFVTGAVLLLGGYFGSKNYSGTLNFLKATVIGISQGIAIIPGVSRSGLTISSGLLCKLDKVTSVKFSMLISIPAILGAFLLKLKGLDLNSQTAICPFCLIVGALSAAFVGFFTIKFLITVLNKNKFYIFSIYCFIAGLLMLIF